MARLSPARSLLLCLVAAVVGLAACAKSNSSSSVPPTPTASPTTTPSAGPSSTPVPAAAGIAYLPDAGNGGPAGITVAHFEEFTGVAYPYQPQFVNFRGSVRYLVIDTQNTTSLAVLKGSSGYTLLQGVLGLGTQTIFPGGNPYDTSAPPPSPAPTDAVVPDITSEAMIGDGIDAVGLSMGPASDGILGVNQASTQTPTYNGFINFPCKNRKPTYLSGYTSIAASLNGDTTSGDYSVLVRGPKDLLTYSVHPNFGIVPPVYTFCYQAESTGLGAELLATPGAAGRGLMAFTSDASRAIVGQSTTTQGSVALISGLPFAINKATSLSLNGGRVNSVAVAPNGQFAGVGTDQGFFILTGLNGNAMSIVGQGANHSKRAYAPQYKGADGHYHPVANVTSVGFSADGLYLAALVSLYPDASGGTTGGTLVILPFNSRTGILSAPAVADNNLPLNAYYQDLMTVR